MPLPDVEFRAGVADRSHSGVDLYVSTHVLTFVELFINSQLFEVFLLGGGESRAHLIG
jgi:hypothetical protein